MSQFTAYLFQEERRYRILVDGLGSESARSLFEAEDAARRLIERHVRASYPERRPSTPDDALGAMNFQLEIVRADGSRERRELWLRVAKPRRARKR
ncbi:MAG: hypothetical protein WCB18_03465 [Thermoplasmata archaeon]